MAGTQVDVPLTPVTGRPRATHPGCTTIKYNRRANPELDKRRTHFCNYPGKQTAVGKARWALQGQFRTGCAPGSGQEIGQLGSGEIRTLGNRSGQNGVKSCPVIGQVKCNQVYCQIRASGVRKSAVRDRNMPDGSV